MRAPKKQAGVGIGVSNNVMASVKRRARLGIYPPTGQRKNARIPKGEAFGGILWKEEGIGVNGEPREYQFHATKGFRNQRIWR